MIFFKQGFFIFLCLKHTAFKKRAFAQAQRKKKNDAFEHAAGSIFFLEIIQFDFIFIPGTTLLVHENHHNNI